MGAVFLLQQNLTKNKQIKVPEIFKEDNDRENDSNSGAENLLISDLNQAKAELEKYRALYILEKERGDALRSKIKIGLRFLIPHGIYIYIHLYMRK